MEVGAGEWVAMLASRLGTAVPTETETETLLALAGLAARSSERKAAPISCWLAAQAGRTPEEALAVAHELAADLEGTGEGRPSAG